MENAGVSREGYRSSKDIRREATGTGSSTRYIRSIRYEERGKEHIGAFVVRIIHGSGITPPYWIDSSRSVRGGIERPLSDAALGLAHGWEPYDAEEAVERVAICLWGAIRPSTGIDVRSDESYSVRVVDGVAVAECRVRYWSLVDVSAVEQDSVLPKFGRFRVAINAETNQLIAAECKSFDRATDLAELSAAALKDVYESAGVLLSPGTASKITKTLAV